jgi:O-acetyl-ADP-ribose deacetylase (regulator of RNase III)
MVLKGGAMLSVIRADITTLKVDAIVNAANTTLLGGGGVDGAIHQAAGPELLEECRSLGGCRTGEAKVTKGYRLPARYVIHTVGPVWHGGSHREEDDLAKCYRSCFEAAQEYGVRSIAFPSISTGAYGFPVERAAVIALREIGEALRRDPSLDVTVACFDDRTIMAYEAARTP